MHTLEAKEFGLFFCLSHFDDLHVEDLGFWVNFFLSLRLGDSEQCSDVDSSIFVRHLRFLPNEDADPQFNGILKEEAGNQRSSHSEYPLKWTRYSKPCVAGLIRRSTICSTS